MANPCWTPPWGVHRCQVSDDAEAVARNLALFSHLADPTILPPFPWHRQRVILAAWRRATRRKIPVTPRLGPIAAYLRTRSLARR